MKSDSKAILAIAILLLPTLACNAGSAVPTASTGNPTTSTQTVTGPVLFSDDFSSLQWGTGTDSDSSVEYSNKTLQMKIFAKNLFVWSHPNNRNYQNVHMEVTALNNGTDSTTAFGLMCDWQTASNGSFYYFAITPAGQYAIAKASKGQSDKFLTNNDQFAASDLIKQNASSYRVGADCSSNGTLALYVDGQQIASVSDVAYTDGGVAVFTWSGEEATTTNVSFDDFLMTDLQ